MSDSVEIWEQPKTKEIYMLAGWRQWVDGGAISSGLPRYLIQQTKAAQIGKMTPDGYYLFQLPGTQHFMRPMVRHNDGHPESLNTQRNEFYYTEVDGKGFVIFIGDEPHMDVERYTRDLLNVVKLLRVRRVIMFGGIYAEVPYDKERYVTSIFSLDEMRAEINDLSVDLSNYQGPGSIGSYFAKRAGEQQIEAVGFYAFCPIFQFGNMDEITETMRIENDYIAWLGAMRRVNHMLSVNFDLDDLEVKSDQLIDKVRSNIDELDKKYPDLKITEYMETLSTNFQESIFSPLDDVWGEELRRLGDEFFPSDE